MCGLTQSSPLTPLLPTVDLPAEVQRLLAQIPRGCVTTYGDLARAMGDDKTRAARWLGDYLHDHPHDVNCPCHRVVRSNGELGLHVSDDPQLKARLLRSEGVSVSEFGMVDLTERVTQFQSSRPLEQLREFQKGLAQAVILQGDPGEVRTIAGVDVAYRSDGTACGAYVLLDAQSLQVIQELTLFLPTRFPYIPGYLTFRELPVMQALCEEARRQGALGDVIFCDGNGQLHPWRAGIATCLGVLIDHPVIGVGKSLLFGKSDLKNADPAACNILDNEIVIARAIRVSPKSKPVYISVGHRLSLSQAVELTMKTFSGHRLPEPIHQADRLTKRIRRTP